MAAATATTTTTTCSSNILPELGRAIEEERQHKVNSSEDLSAAARGEEEARMAACFLVA